MIEEFPTFYSARSFVAVFTITCNWTLSGNISARSFVAVFTITCNWTLSVNISARSFVAVFTSTCNWTLSGTYSARSFVAVFTRTCNWTLSGTISVQASSRFTCWFLKVCLSTIFPLTCVFLVVLSLQGFRQRKVSLHEVCKHTWCTCNNLNKTATSQEMHYLQFVFLLSDITSSSAFRVRPFGLFKFRINLNICIL
jgi:hypothetical protein